MRYLALIPAAILVAVCAIVLTGKPHTADPERNAATGKVRLEPPRQTAAPLLATPATPLPSASTPLLGSVATPPLGSAATAQNAAEPPASDGDALAAVEVSTSDAPDHPPAGEAHDTGPAFAKNGATVATQECSPTECRERNRPLRLRRIPVVNRRDCR